MADTIEHNRAYNPEINFIDFYQLLRNNIILILISVAFTLSIGFVYISTIKPSFRYTLPISLPYSYSSGGAAIGITRVEIEVKAFMNDIRQNIVRASGKYNIPLALLEEIKQISFSQDPKNKDIFYLTVNAFSSDSIGKITQAVITVLDNLEAVQRVKKNDQQLIELEQSKNIEFLNGLKDKYGEMTNVVESKAFQTYGVSPVQVYSQILNIEKKLLSIEQAKEKMYGFNPIGAAMLPTDPTEPKKSLILITALIAGLFAGIGLVFLRDKLQAAKSSY